MKCDPLDPIGPEGSSPDGRVVAEGRDTEILDLGGGRVLRRPRVPRDLTGEVAAMRAAADAGFPVVTVHEVRPDGLVLERLDGIDMLTDLGRAPWRMGRHAATLASLQRRLGAIPAPDGLAAPFGSGDRLVHLDLHPGNVLLTSRGPVVIDWANAARGPAGADVAATWLLLAAAQPPEGSRLDALVTTVGRRWFLSRFLRHADRAAGVAMLAAVVALRRTDPNMSAAELQRMEEVVRAEVG